MVSIGNGNSLYRLLDEGNGRKTRPMLAAESTSEILPSDAGRGKRRSTIGDEIACRNYSGPRGLLFALNTPI